MLTSNPPGQHAGNMDNKELVAGTTVFIPVWAPGALFEVGDGHAVQGDGEVNQTGLETSLQGRLQFVLRRDFTIDWPRGETDTHYGLKRTPAQARTRRSSAASNRYATPPVAVMPGNR